MKDYQDDIEQCLRVLRSGGLILYPTDTIWGSAAMPPTRRR